MSKELIEMIKREYRSKGNEITVDEASLTAKNIVEFFRLLWKWDEEEKQSEHNSK